jgi:UDP-N-acetylglucosamine 2-epimerase (non-hydrolysing)
MGDRATLRWPERERKGVVSVREPLGIVVVVGTRPEAIKLLPVIRSLHDNPHFAPFVVSTGQHSGLVRSVLGLAGLEPDVDLGVGRRRLTLNKLFRADAST